jgi:hypothetical protein
MDGEFFRAQRLVTGGPEVAYTFEAIIGARVVFFQIPREFPSGIFLI